VSDHPQDLPLREQAAAVAAGELDATELLDLTLERITERDASVNAVVDRFASESARMLAEAPDGPLHGVPVAVKDQFALPWRAPRDGAFVNTIGVGKGESGVFRRLRDAGAVVVGVTQMHELGLGSTGHVSIYGACANPWDVSRCAGGSSGGSAAAVAARMVAGAVGTDGGGSIRFPSGYCGVTGLKLTWGRTPTDGSTIAFSSLAAAGPICRDAADARLLGEALLGHALERGRTAGLRIGVPWTQLWEDLDPEVERACRDAVETLETSGLGVDETALEGVEHAAMATVLPLSLEALPSTDPDAVAEAAPHFSPLITALAKSQLLMPATILPKAERVRTQLRRSLAHAFERFDLLAWPTQPAPAPPIEDTTVMLPSGSYPADFANVRLGGIANLTGVPAISVPCGLTAAGLPTALQLLAPWGEEARLFDVAERLEQATDRHHVDLVPPVAQTTAA
jgi:Asp-tRNA(Asn)/Glu-tRNA(Gln) amidotransferase A subunit family amidase